MRLKASHILCCWAMTLLVACTPLEGDAVPTFEVPRLAAAVEPSVTASPVLTPVRPSTATGAAVGGAAAPVPAAEATGEAEPSRYGNPLARTVADPAQIALRGLAEGYVAVYSDTSRAETAVEALMAAYPGFGAEAYALGSQDIYLRLLDDLARGEPVADVYLVSDPARTLSLAQAGLLWSYLPKGVERAMPIESREPLPTHHWTAVIPLRHPAYVGEGAPASAVPVNTWWDLTRPEWRGRVVLPDPRYNERMTYLLITMVQHSQDLADAYRVEFGAEAALDADCPNAAYQWIKLLLANEPVRVFSDADVARVVSDSRTDGVDRIGICGSEQLAKAVRGELELEPLFDLLPTPGLRWRTYVAVPSGAQRPHAACLLIEWLFGDQAGGGGYLPWREAGFYPARHDVAEPSGAPSRWTFEPLLWETDAEYVLHNLAAVQEQIRACSGEEITLSALP